MSKQPIQPTTTQMKRMRLEHPGGGFIMYRMRDSERDETYKVEVVEIFVNLETGEITKADGSPLVFWTDKNQSVGYKLVKVTGQSRMEI